MKLARDLEFPTDEAPTQKFLVLGRTGSGKTNTCAVMAEELLAQRCPFIVFDPLGNWWGLKSKYQVIQFGGEKGDLPLEPTAGKVVADFAVSERQPLILSLKEFSENDMARFATDFAKELYRRNKHPVHVFVDEADLFAPQTGAKGPRAVCLGAMQNLMRRGRACGIGMTAVTQRSASLHTDLRTQAEVLISHQTTGPHDVEAIRKWLQYHIGDEMADVLKQISKLQPGEAWVFSPGWLDILAKFKIRRRKSFDSAATPKLGQRRKIPPFKKIKLDALKNEMSRVVEQADANDPEKLKKEVWRLKQELHAAKILSDRIAEGDPDQVKALQARVTALESAYGELWQQYRQSLIHAQEHLDTLDAVRDMTMHGTVISIPPEEPELKLPAVPVSAAKRELAKSPIKDMLAKEDTKFLAAVNGSGGNSDLSNMQQKFLTALAQHPEGLTKKQLLILTGYASSGPVSKCFGQMNRDGWVESPNTSQLRITPLGLSVLGPYEPLPSGAELRQLRLQDPQLKPVDKAILEVLFQHYPSDIAKGEILKETGYASSGPVSKSFGKLCRLGWAVKVGQGRLKASETFYE